MKSKCPRWRGLRVLVFSKTQTFRHDSIAEGHVCLRRLAQRHGFQMTSTEDAAMFNRDALAEFDVVVFLNTTGDVLNDQQQSAFQSWYQSGGAFLGVHAASDTEHGWDWFGQLVGRFRCHPAVQPARLIVMDRGHPATAHLGQLGFGPTSGMTSSLMVPMRAATALLRIDENTYTGGQTGPWHPMAWSHEFDGGRSFYTALGHTKATFSEPAFEQHLLGGLAWVAGQTGEFTALGGQFCPRLPKKGTVNIKFFCVWAAEEIYPCQLRPTLLVCSMPVVWP